MKEEEGKSGRTMISFDGRGDSELKREICNGEKSPLESRRGTVCLVALFYEMQAAFL